MMYRLRIVTTDTPPRSHSPHSTIASTINVCAVAAKVRHKIIVECSRILNYISVELSSRQPRASVVPYMVYYIYIIPPPLLSLLPYLACPSPTVHSLLDTAYGPEYASASRVFVFGTIFEKIFSFK